jgi:predicted ATPase
VLAELAAGSQLPRQNFLTRLKAKTYPQAPALSAQFVEAIDAVTPGLSSVLLRCLEPSPASRLSTAGELRSELEILQGYLGVHPRLRTWLHDDYADRVHSTQPRPPDSAQTETTATRSEGERTAVVRKPRDRTNLGPPRDTFVGRESELAELDQLLDGGARLITVKGPGGAGKTRFCRRMARRHAYDLEGGVWFVDLTSARSATGLIQATAAALGLALGGEDEDALVRQVGFAIAGRGAVLIILDNFEQVVEAAPNTLGVWLEMAPEATFVTTSREPLRLNGEHVFPLDPLPPSDAAKLFELRATAAGASWSQTKETRAVIAQIVGELDGLPLAIELAAGRARLLSPEQLLERLAQPLRLLRGGRRDGTGRQATLRGMIEWSWELLEEWEKAALTQLSVFEGGFFMEAAEAVLDLSSWTEAPWSLDVVGSLFDKSLLRCWDVAGRPRFGMYVSVRDYAAGKLAASPALGGIAPTSRHASYYARFGDDDFRESLHTHGGTARWQLLTLEKDNLVAALEASLTSAVPGPAANCALAWWELVRMEGPFRPGVTLLGRVLDLKSLTARQRMRLIGNRAWLLHLAGRPNEARKQLEAALKAAAELGDSRFEGIWLGNLGTLRRDEGLITEALQYYEGALERARAQGDPRFEGIWLGSLGNLSKDSGLLAEAEEQYQGALAIATQIGDRRYQGSWRGALGLLKMELGETAAAVEHTEAALSLARERSLRRLEGIWLGNLGLLRAEQGRSAEALQDTEEALALSRELGDRRAQGLHLGNLGDLLVQRGDWPAAADRYEEAIALGDATWPVVAGVFRGSLALLRACNGDLASARSLLGRGEEQLRGVHALELGKLLCKRSRVEAAADESETAQEALAEARQIAADRGVGPDSELGKEIAKAEG